MKIDKESLPTFIPNTTQVPNIVLDWMMAELSGSEFKTLMFFIRQRYGFLRFTGEFRYSIQQIAEGIWREITNEQTGERELVQVCAGTGLNKESVTKAVASLANKRLISHKSGKDRKVSNAYSLMIDEHEKPVREIRKAYTGKPDSPIRENRIELYGKPVTLETKEKEREKQPPKLHEVAVLWNEKADPVFPRVLITSDDRLKKISLRLSEGIDFPKVIELMNQGPFLKGIGGRGWVADFDWIIANGTNWLKVMEGKYSPRGLPKKDDLPHTVIDQNSKCPHPLGEDDLRKAYSLELEKHGGDVGRAIQGFVRGAWAK